MELKELTVNKRNTLQIYSLVKETTDVLKHEASTVLVPINKAKVSNIQSGLEKSENEKKIKTSGQVSMLQQPIKEKNKDSNEGKSIAENKKLTFDEASKYFSSYINTCIVSTKVTTFFWHRQSKYSGHGVESEKPNIYEIYHPQGSTKSMLSLIAVLEQIIINDIQEIEKHVILHFDVKNDIPCIFNMAFKMMGISEKVTNRYENFKKYSTKKILIAGYRAFRGLEYPRVVVFLDQNVTGLEQYIPECLSRCTTYLHAILLKEDSHMLHRTKQKDTTLKSVITSWKKQYRSKRLINYWIVHVFGSHTNKVTEKFCEKCNSGVIKINSTSSKYEELETYFGKLQCFQNESSNKEKNIQEEIDSAVIRLETLPIFSKGSFFWGYHLEIFQNSLRIQM